MHHDGMIGVMRRVVGRGVVEVGRSRMVPMTAGNGMRLRWGCQHAADAIGCQGRSHQSGHQVLRESFHDFLL